MAVEDIEALRKRAGAAAVLSYVALGLFLLGFALKRPYPVFPYLIALPCSIIAIVLGRSVRKQLDKKENLNDQLKTIRGKATRGVWISVPLLVVLAPLMVLAGMAWTVEWLEAIYL